MLLPRGFDWHCTETRIYVLTDGSNRLI